MEEKKKFQLAFKFIPANKQIAGFVQTEGKADKTELQGEWIDFSFKLNGIFQNEKPIQIIFQLNKEYSKEVFSLHFSLPEQQTFYVKAFLLMEGNEESIPLNISEIKTGFNNADRLNDLLN